MDRMSGCRFRSSWLGMLAPQILSTTFFLLLTCYSRAQKPIVLLPQGTLVGSSEKNGSISRGHGSRQPHSTSKENKVTTEQIFQESSSVPVDTFLGIPYAAPPIGRLRFSAPARHRGWNRTLFAQTAGPRCLQPPDPDANPNFPLMHQSEDCLYLNIWVPQNTHQIGRLPVIVFLHSETFSRNAPIDLPGQELAAEGVIVVSPAYRLNVFGFLTLATPEARGNLGLLDQYMALLWVKENIGAFGGSPEDVTLMGHSAGANSVLYHMISPRTEGLFSNAVIMSPVDVLEEEVRQRALTEAEHAAGARYSRGLAVLLNCTLEDPADTLRCLQAKPPGDLLRAFNIQYRNGNWSNSMRPVRDAYLAAGEQYLPRTLADALRERAVRAVPVLVGHNDAESANDNELLRQLDGLNEEQLSSFTEHNVIPTLLSMHGFDGNQERLSAVISWEYGVGGEAAARALSGARAAALLRLASALAPALPALNLYEYAEPDGVDLYGRTHNTSGAAHDTELPPALGLLQQLLRRRATPREQRVARLFRRLLLDFATGRGADWPPGPEYVRRVGGEPGRVAAMTRAAALWGGLLPRLAAPAAGAADATRMNSAAAGGAGAGGADTLRRALYALLALVLGLSALLAACVVLLRRAARRRDIT